MTMTTWDKTDGISLKARREQNANLAEIQAMLTSLATLTATMTEINRAADTSARIVNLAAATLALTEAAHDGKIITVNKADGAALTLPAATGSGAMFKIIVGTTITSSALTVKVTGNDVMFGHCWMAADGGDTVVAFETAADSDTITMNGTTQGGYKGAVIELVDIAADTWSVQIRCHGTSSEASPFSATVT